MISEVKNQPVSFLGSIASIVAFINTVFAVPMIISGYETPSFVLPISMLLITCLFFLLEGSLASVFSKFFILLRKQGPGFPLMMMCVNAIVSAGVTAYNCLWMFISQVEGNSNKISVFIIVMFIGWLISVYFLNVHCKQQEKLEITNSAPKLESEISSKYVYHYWVSFTLNAIAFVFMFSYFVNTF